MKTDYPKKYPVTYKNQEYEVRWVQKTYTNDYWNIPYIEMRIYEVKKWIFGKKYIFKYSQHESDISSDIDILNSNPDYYIKEVEELFRKWQLKLDKEIKRDIIEATKKQNLLNWDGIIKD